MSEKRGIVIDVLIGAGVSSCTAGVHLEYGLGKALLCFGALSLSLALMALLWSRRA